jgi:hypothetical protein
MKAEFRQTSDLTWDTYLNLTVRSTIPKNIMSLVTVSRINEVGAVA